MIRIKKELLMTDVLNLKNVPSELRNDKEVVLKAVAQNGRTHVQVTKKLQKDKDFVLNMVALNGKCIV